MNYRDNPQQKLIINEVLDACEKGDLELVEKLIEKIDFNLDCNIENKISLKLLSTSCKYGNLEIAKYLINSPHSSEYINIGDNISNALSHSIANNQLPIISYLMNEPSLNRSKLFYDSFSWQLSKATSADSLELFKTLLNLEHPKNSIAYLLAQEDKLSFACHDQHHKIIEYVIKTPALKEYVDLDNWFEIVSTYNNKNLLNFFIFDLKIQPTDRIKEFIKEHDLTYVQCLFDNRKLQEQLHFELIPNQNTTIKLKV